LSEQISILESHDTIQPQLKGAMLIADQVKRLPNKAGVYRMIGAAGKVLYVGKARNLKKRVASYGRATGHSNRIERMIGETVAMEFVVTHTETEALLLEANLIKTLRPRYNVLLRDDKSFPYIVITQDHPAPALIKHRGNQSKKGYYFGPFASTGAVNRTLNSLQRAFLLRNCSDGAFENRSRPCLLHQIKRCAAPCTNEISRQDYGLLVDEARAFLSGKSQHVRDDMAKLMYEAAQRLDFERAALYRDRLAALSHIQGHQGINPQHIDEADVFACVQAADLSSIQVFFFRAGQNWGNCAYFLKTDSSLDPSEVLSSFLAQFYDDKPIPRLILLSHALEEMPLMREAFSLKSSRNVQIMTPKRGEKKELVDHALTNAEQALERRLAELSSQKRLLQALAKSFDLQFVPRRLEVYDNSHIMGSHAVGAMIVAGEEGFVKNQYRKFNIRSQDITPGDDYGMMREVITRRFSRLLKECALPGAEQKPLTGEETEKEDGLPLWPDLLLIDGGRGQMKVVHEVLEQLGLDGHIVAIGVAKGVDRDAGRERFFVKGKMDFSLPPRDGVLYFIQRLRDEAHRFAIGAHRSRRKKALVKNPLDEIEGIGPIRKRALLGRFGTARAVSRAAIEDLMAVEGISQSLAQDIHDHFEKQ